MNYDEVACAVLRTLDPATPQAQRATDFQLCELAKQSPECFDMGLQLAAAHRPPVVRHFALHCIEYFVKHEWNRLKASDKAALKEALFGILEREVSTLVQTDSFLTDAFAKAICEIAKREWPQNWPAFLPESLALAARGAIQLETVLKLLLRLSDDVIVLQCVAQPQRRRDIRQALDEAMNALLDFFESTLVRHYTAFEQLTSSGAGERDAHLRLCDATLTCLASYFEWVTIGKLNERVAAYANGASSADDGSKASGQLLTHLFALLRSDHTRLRTAACELLLAVATKCGASKILSERAPFLQIALSQHTLSIVAFAADRAANVAASDAREYAFLKRLAQLVATIGSTLVAIVPTTPQSQAQSQSANPQPAAPSVPQPLPNRRARNLQKATSSAATSGLPVTVEWSAALPALVDVAYAFTVFPAHTVAEWLVPFWAALFRHPALVRDPLVVERVLPNILSALRNALLKIGFPSTADARPANSSDTGASPNEKRAVRISTEARSRAAFALLDFDNDESFALFLTAFRNALADLVHAVAQAHPAATFRFACEWLAELLALPIDRTAISHVLSKHPNVADGSAINGNGSELQICTVHSVSYIDWDALAYFCDACMLRVFNSKTCEFLLSQAELVDGANALRAVLAFQTPHDPLVAWCVTTVRSGLSPFVKADPGLVLPLLTSLLATVRFDLPGQNRLSRFKSVKTLRQQTCQALIKLTKMHADLLLPVFEQFSEHCIELITRDENLLELERVNLLEAVIILSNSLRNYAAQEQFLLKVTSHGCDVWLSDAAQRALSSTPLFIDYFGLDRPPADAATEASAAAGTRPQFDEYGVRRLNLLFAVNSLLAAVRRCEVPAEPNARRLGGFETRLPCGAYVTRNPALTTFKRVASAFYACFRNVNALQNTDARQRVADAYRPGLFAIPAQEKAFILGTVSSVPTRNLNTAERKSAGERMLHFFYVLHENCVQVLACCFAHLGHEFYHSDSLCSHFAGDVLFELENFDDYYLRPFVRSVLRTLLANCTLCTSLQRATTADDTDSPVDANSALSSTSLGFFDQQLFPFLARLFAYLLARFSPRWEQLAAKMREREMGVLSELERHSQSDTQADDSAKRERILALRKYGVDADADEQLNEAEIIDEQLLRLVSRELLAAVATLFSPLPNVTGSAASSQPDANVSSSNASVHVATSGRSTMDIESRSSDDEDDANANGVASAGSQQQTAAKWLFSDFARYAIRHAELRQAVLECLLASARWCDTAGCAKAAQCVVSMLRLLADGGLLTEDLARAFLIFALNGIAINGHDESCKLQLITAAINVYEHRAQFPTLLDVLRQIPNTTLDLLNQFDSLFARTDPPRPASDKQKRELLRRVVEPIVKQSLSTRFSDRDVRILDLPPVFRPSKRALWRLANRRANADVDSADAEDSQLGLGALFAGD